LERIVACAINTVGFRVCDSSQPQTHEAEPETAVFGWYFLSVGLARMFLEVGRPVDDGATTTPPPTKDEVEKLLAVAPRPGIEVRLPHYG
jgi:hypothetical protein